MNKIRNSSIELLRIIAMMGIIVLHYNNKNWGGGFKYVAEGSLHQRYLYLTESLFIGAVNLFILISAFYLVDTNVRKLSKVVELIIQLIVFRLAFFLANICLGQNFSTKDLLTSLLPCSYFVTLYSVLYLLSPYINLLIARLSQKQFTKLLALLFFVFSVLSMLVDVLNKFVDANEMSPIGYYGSQSGYTIVNFVLLYFIGAYIKKYDITFSGVIKAILLFGLCGLIYVTSLLSKVSWNYNNPLVILMAATILIIFKDVQYSNKVINDLAKAAFTCYLFHATFLKYVGVERFATGRFRYFVLHQVGVVIALYLASYIVYKLYYVLSNWFFRLIRPHVDKIDLYSLNE